MEAVYNFCGTEITSIKFFLIEKDLLQMLKNFYIEGMRWQALFQEHCHFESDSVGVLQFKRVR